MKAATKTRLWFLISTALALALPPLLLRAEPPGYDANRSKVNTMTQTERNRLERLYRDFLALSEVDQARFRGMHQRLLDDQTDGRGRLQQAMQDYYAWLTTIPQNQREDLARATDPQQRITLTEAFLEQQKTRDAHAEMREIMSDRDLAGRFQRVPHLSAEELAAVMAEVESSVTMTQSQRERLDPPDEEPRQGIERYLEFFRILGDRGNLKLDKAVDSSDADRVLRALPNDEIRNKLSAIESRSLRARALLFIIVANLRMEIERERNRRRPGDEDLEAFLEQLAVESPTQFDELVQLEPEAFRTQLERLYVAQFYDLDFKIIARTLPVDWRQGPRTNGDSPRRPGGRPPPRDDRPRPFRDDNRPRDGD